MLDVIRASARGVGSNGGWASLVTGKHVEFGPDLSLFVSSRADAYRLVDWVTPLEPTEEEKAATPSHSHWHRVDRAKVDYRDFEPGWLQVKLIAEEEHRAVLERLSEALHYRDGYLDEKLIRWAIDPTVNWNTAKGYQSHHREALEAMTAAANAVS